MVSQNPFRCVAACLLLLSGACPCDGFTYVTSEEFAESHVIGEEIEADLFKLYDRTNITCFLRSAIEMHPVIDGYDLTKTDLADERKSGVSPDGSWDCQFGDWRFKPGFDESKIARTRVFRIRAREYHEGEYVAPELRGVRVVVQDPLLWVRVSIPAQTGRFSLTWYIPRDGDAEWAVSFLGHLEPDGSTVLDSISSRGIITFH